MNGQDGQQTDGHGRLRGGVLSLKTLGVFLALSGVASAVTLGSRGLATVGDASLIVVAVIVIYLATALVGVLLVLGRAIGQWMGMAVMALQVPFIQLGSLTYVITTRPSAELKIWPQLGFAASNDLQMVLAWQPMGHDLYFGVNLVAVVALVVVIASSRGDLTLK